jgi:hypothetical protein
METLVLLFFLALWGLGRWGSAAQRRYEAEQRARQKGES